MAPAFGLDQGIRDALHADAVKLCKSIGYQNAGTVEFMVDKHGGYYFLEVNPRIQARSQPHLLDPDPLVSPHACVDRKTG